ncbi:MAG: hypothetical protein ACQESR_27300 [Planctomycetota bacterium]
MESGPTQAVLPLVGLAAEKIIRDRYIRVLQATDAPGFFQTTIDRPPKTRFLQNRKWNPNRPV